MCSGGMTRRLGKALLYAVRAWRNSALLRVARDLTDIIPAPVCVVSSPALRLEVANRALSELLQGCSMGRTTLRDVFPSGAVDTLCGLSEPRRLPAVSIGAETYLDWVAWPLAGGHFIALVGHDVTEYVRALAQLRRKCEAAQREKREEDEFLSQLLHELRNPLASMRAAVAVAKQADTCARDKACLVLERQTKHLSRLVDDLFDLMRGQIRAPSLRRERLDLAALIEQAVECTEPLVRSRNHTLVVDTESELWLDGDSSRLYQVICNLIGNAAKYTAKGGSIRIVARRNRREIAVTIADTGMGIPPELQARIFDRFVRAPEAVRRSEPGLGIGLYVVRTLILLHGGRVEVHSDGPGRGSSFTIHLPSEPDDPAQYRLERADTRPRSDIGPHVVRSEAGFGQQQQAHEPRDADDRVDHAADHTRLLHGTATEHRIHQVPIEEPD